MTDGARGAGQLLVTATRQVTDLVEELHEVVAAPLTRSPRPVAGRVYEAVRRVALATGVGVDRTLAALSPLVRTASPGPRQDALIAAMNGVFGDHLAETGNPLAIPMRARVGGRPLPLEPGALGAALPDAGPRPLVLVHGSCMSDRQWLRRGHEHGAALARDLGVTPVWIHYNSGLHISTNGGALAALLEQLVAAWPTPIADLTLVGHSMGGLVIRSACHTAEAERLRWRPALTRFVGLGVPHHGAPLERAGNLLHATLGATRHSAPLTRLARIRSAGVTDLRHGYVLDEHWQGHDRFARTGDRREALRLPEGVRCYAVAATLAKRMKRALPGDGLVPVDSALGHHPRPELRLAFPDAHRHVALATGHLDLLDSAEVYATLRRWLTP